jgi:hypothetical protein
MQIIILHSYNYEHEKCLEHNLTLSPAFISELMVSLLHKMEQDFHPEL